MSVYKLPEFTVTRQLYEDSKQTAALECCRICQRVLQVVKFV